MSGLKDIFFRNYNLLTVLGPTASGKTAFAVRLADILNGEIISADSRQVYRGMDIGTGKDLDDYQLGDKKIRYHLIDIANAGEKYNLFRFQQDFFRAYEDIVSRGKMPILCGGTGLYIDAIVRNYQLLDVPANQELRRELEKKSLEELAEILKSLKKLHNTTEIDTKNRAIRAIEIELYNKKHPRKKSNFPEIKSLVIGLKYDRKLQRQKITQRLEKRLKNGMIAETERLIWEGVPIETLIYYGLEYKYTALYIAGAIDYKTLFAKLNTAIHRFAKRQMTFFRRMERLGVKIHWIDAALPMQKKIDLALKLITDVSD